MDQNAKFLPWWWRRKYCFSESFLEVGFDYQYWLAPRLEDGRWFACSSPLTELVGAKLILLTLLDTILYGNNQFRDVSTFSLHTTSPIRTIIKFLQHQNNNDTSFEVESIHHVLYCLTASTVYSWLKFFLCTLKTKMFNWCNKQGIFVISGLL